MNKLLGKDTPSRETRGFTDMEKRQFAENVEKWLEENAIECRRYAARISPATCATYRREEPEGCKGCDRRDGEPPLSLAQKMGRAGAKKRWAHPGSSKPEDEVRTIAVALSFVGEDAEIIKRFCTLSEADGHNPSEDLATIIGMVLDGRLQPVDEREKGCATVPCAAVLPKWNTIRNKN